MLPSSFVPCKPPVDVVEIFIDLLNFKKEIRNWSTMTTPFLAIRKYVNYSMRHSHLTELVNSKSYNSNTVDKGAYSIMLLLLALDRERLMPPGIVGDIFQSGHFYFNGKYIKVAKTKLTSIPNLIAYNDGVYKI